MVNSKLRRHKVMEKAIKALMSNNLPPRFKFKDTYDSIEVPSGYTLPSQQDIEDKFDELLAEEESMPTIDAAIEDIQVISSNLYVNTNTGRVGIGTTTPGYTLDVNGTANVGALTATTISGPLTGNATTATTLQTARTIGGVSFDGSGNIDLPGVNTTGNQNTSGNAATATTATNQSGGTVNATTGAFSGNVTLSGGKLIASSSVTTDSTSGIMWHGSNSGYSITRTSGAWSSPNYQQLLIKWNTGMILDVADGQYGRSYVGVNDRMAIGSSYYNSNTKPPDNGLLVQGNVGIGTTSPGYKLDVAGTLHAGNSYFDNVYIGGSTTRGLRAVSGNYGTVQTTGGGAGNWEGYSIDGRYVFMSENDNHCGIYNDVDNEWMIYCYRNSYVRLYYNGATKLQTTNTGVSVTGGIEMDGKTLNAVSGLNWNSGTSTLSVNGGITKTQYNQGEVIEELHSVCNSTSLHGRATIQNVTGYYAIPESYGDATGSVVTNYTPPTGTKTIVYEFVCMLQWFDAHAISHWKLYFKLGSGSWVEVSKARFSRSGYYAEDKVVTRWVFTYNASSADNSLGVITGTPVLSFKWMVRDYGGSNERGGLHRTQYWDGGGTDMYSQPMIMIKAIA